MDDLRLSVLGPMQVRRGAAQLRTGGPQQQAMLAVLLLRRGLAVGAGELAEAIWGDEPPGTATGIIRTYAWRWRRVLEDGEGPQVLATGGDGYRLDLPTSAVDVFRAEEAAACAERASTDGETAQARDLLDAALAFWRGEPLAGIPGPFADRWRRLLADRRLALLEERIALDLALGGHRRCVPELTELAAAHPLRERVHLLLMRALAQAGRTADALAAFRTVRRTLVGELGIGPGAELESEHRRILAGGSVAAAPSQPAVRAAVPRAAAQPVPEAVPGPVPRRPAVAVLPVPGQLPPDTSDFVGRETLVMALGEALVSPVNGSPAIVSVAGMGGVGKTTLALHVAHQVRRFFPDGQLYADLRGEGPDGGRPAAVLANFLTALGIAPEAVPDGTEDRSALLRSLLADRRLLLVLENADEAASVRPLLPGTAGSAVLLTSRTGAASSLATLHTDLELFTPEEALGLLGRVIGPERLAAERPAALGLVSACGHLPLAVRIVAARLAARPAWTVASMNDRLAVEVRRIDELRIGDLAVEAAFALGYRQLSADQARAFRLVAAVPGPDIGLNAAAAVLAVGRDDAEDLLESLVDVRMVESLRIGRYRYHDLLRSFAQRTSRRTDPGEAAAARQRLLGFLTATGHEAFRQGCPGDEIDQVFARPSTTGLSFADRVAAQAWVSAESGTAVALAHRIGTEPPDGEGADPDHRERLNGAVDLLVMLSPFELGPHRGPLTEAVDALAEAAVRRGDARAEGRARFLRGNIALDLHRLSEARRQTRLAAAASRAAGDTAILRQVLNDGGLVAQYLADYEEADALYGEAVELARRLGHRAGEVATRVNVALARVYGGRAEEGAAVCRAVLADLARGLPGGPAEEGPGRAYAMYVLGLALHTLGDHPEAAEWFGRSMALASGLGLEVRAAQSRYRLADSLRAAGRLRQAVEHAEAALAACEDLGAERDQAHALLALGRALTELGEEGRARACLLRARALFTGLGLPVDAHHADLVAGLVAVRTV
ncbi:AfsR/SARP family transcriptional regulator [Kitasatospora arboriphila]